MKKIDSIFVLTVLFSVQIAAQTPVFIPAKSTHSVQNHQENTCNYAGTIEVGQFIGQSSSTALDTIFLCLGDSILINHHGDADLSGDPNPATAPGIVFGYYNCPPTVSGSTLQDVLGDPCLLEGSSSGLFVTQGVQNEGSTWFVNNGLPQDIFNLGQPLSLYFAPMTIDDFGSNAYEYAQVGAPPGPCVNANLSEAFEVIYLNEILASGISNNDGDDCLGRFTVKGGFPEYEGTATYDIDISLISNPLIEAQILNSPANLFHLASVVFSVSEPGIYTVNIEDGKSCGHQFQIDMSGCIALNNIALEFDKVAGVQGDAVCVPLKVKNFELGSGAFSVNWDANLLKFKDVGNLHPAISHFFDLDTFANLDFVNIGQLGILLFDSWALGNPIVIPDGETLFDVCFEVLDTTAENCTPVRVSNTPFQIAMEGQFGEIRAITLKTGGICKSVSSTEITNTARMLISPNPVKAGASVYFHAWSNERTTMHLSLLNPQGKEIQWTDFELTEGENSVEFPTISLFPGFYFATLSNQKGLLGTYKVLVF